MEATTELERKASLYDYFRPIMDKARYLLGCDPEHDKDLDKCDGCGCSMLNVEVAASIYIDRITASLGLDYDASTEKIIQTICHYRAAHLRELELEAELATMREVMQNLHDFYECTSLVETRRKLYASYLEYRNHHVRPC